VGRLIAAHRSPPERWNDNPSTDQRMKVATKAIGGWRAMGQLDERFCGQERATWMREYEEARS